LPFSPVIIQGYLLPSSVTAVNIPSTTAVIISHSQIPSSVPSSIVVRPSIPNDLWLPTSAPAHCEN